MSKHLVSKIRLRPMSVSSGRGGNCRRALVCGQRLMRNGADRDAAFYLKTVLLKVSHGNPLVGPGIITAGKIADGAITSPKFESSARGRLTTIPQGHGHLRCQQSPRGSTNRATEVSEAGQMSIACDA